MTMFAARMFITITGSIGVLGWLDLVRTRRETR